VLSFVFVGIYWNNHHHMLHAAHRVNGTVLWANLTLLFWLSLLPFVTAWMGENAFGSVPVAVYGVVCLMCGVSYSILARTIIAVEGKDSLLATAIGRDRKGWVSLAAYAAAVVVAPAEPRVSLGLYVITALMWLVPDRRIESRLAE
jgi:uncharacterized membrane protein